MRKKPPQEDGDDDVLEDLDILNVSPADLEGWFDDDDDEDQDKPIVVLRKNVAALSVFIATWTQWKVVAYQAGFIYLGIDYAVLNEIWQRLSIPEKERNRVFAQLQQIERKILPIRNGK